MCGVMLAMIIFVLDLLKFPVTLNSLTHFPAYNNFIFVTVSYYSLSFSCCSLAAASTSSSCCCSVASSSASFYTISFNLCCPYSIFSIILLYTKKAISRMLSSLFAGASCVAFTGADTALYNFGIVFLQNIPVIYYIFLEKFFSNIIARKND